MIRATIQNSCDRLSRSGQPDGRVSSAALVARPGEPGSSHGNFSEPHPLSVKSCRSFLNFFF